MQEAENDKIVELVEVLKAWRSWAGKYQSNLYHGDLPADGYEKLCRIMIRSETVLTLVAKFIDLKGNE